jgi:hypothetical protein
MTLQGVTLHYNVKICFKNLPQNMSCFKNLLKNKNLYNVLKTLVIMFKEYKIFYLH